MTHIVIDPEFKELLPPLSKESYDALEKSILEEGCRDPLVLWGAVLVDGHNRYEICTKHEIDEYDTAQRNFDSREAAMAWMLEMQMARRNLTIDQMIYYRGKHYELEKSARGGDRKSNYQNDSLNNTAERLAKLHGVGSATIIRDAAFAKSVDQIAQHSPEAKQKILAGQANITKREVQALQKKTPEEVEVIAKQIENDEYVRPEPMPTQETKTCSKCQRELPIGEFYKGKSQCRYCHAERRIVDVKGNPIHSTPEVDALFKTLDINSLVNGSGEYNIDIFAQEVQSLVDYLKRNLRRAMEDEKEMLATSENRKKIAAILIEAETATEQIRREFCHD